MNTRRAFLITAGSALAYGCAAPTPPIPTPPGPTPTPPPQNIIDDISAILAGLVTALPGLSFLPADLLVKIEGWVAQAQQLVSQISGAVSSGSTSQLIQSFVDVVTQIITAIMGVGAIPGWLSTAIGAIQFLLPIILAFLGVGIARRAASPASQTQARMILLTLRVPPTRALPRARG